MVKGLARVGCLLHVTCGDDIILTPGYFFQDEGIYTFQDGTVYDFN